MRKLRIILIALFLVACYPSTVKDQESGLYRIGQSGVYRIHDDELNVTCWGLNRGGVYCIPDWQLDNPNE